MIAARLDLEGITTYELKQAMGDIRQKIPVGFSHQENDIIWDGFDYAPDIPIIQQELNAARKQLGTLGGGNHFIEIQEDSQDRLWVMIHSGSRNFGLKIAKEYHAKAKTLCERWYSNIPDMELAFLPIETKEAKEYLEAMNYALQFAQANRSMMMEKVISVLGNVQETINIHHNYAAFESHFGKNVLVHRKGATRAREGEIGIIPGSQGTKSYITQGLGNADSFQSCSHGAGRKMGRKEAIRTLSFDDEVKAMESKGIIHSIRTEKDLDEAAGAYKDIDTVMLNQKDLVAIRETLKPLGVIKG